ncbi:hypothetical protein FYJ39_08260 [Clostridium sp. WCA-389-WT-23D1]|uniref:Uncharacterized protein n=1 Tax=Clostridium porci TaxID=2605778 RepID=A0A7X2TCW3_9CLOT|nr:hypothetical protein [Clostridium porci]
MTRRSISCIEKTNRKSTLLLQMTAMDDFFHIVFAYGEHKVSIRKISSMHGWKMKKRPFNSSRHI